VLHHFLGFKGSGFWVQGSGFWVQRCRQPKETAGQIEKETNEPLNAEPLKQAIETYNYC